MAKKVRNTVDSGKAREEDTNALQNYIASVASGAKTQVPTHTKSDTEVFLDAFNNPNLRDIDGENRAKVAAKAPDTYGTGYNYKGMTSDLSPILYPNLTQSEKKLNAIVTGQPNHISDLYSPSTEDTVYGLAHDLYGATQGVDNAAELRAIKGGTNVSKGLRVGSMDDKYEEAGWDNYWKYNPDGSLKITPQGPTESSAPQGSADPDSSEDPWKPWNDRMEEIYSQLANLPDYPTLGKFQGPEFSYDYRQDPAYQQYREQYIRNGQLAMKDTMGQAAGLTGGYGSSYSQNAAQQAYQGYMNQLNAVVPQLYKDAYGRYSDDYTRQYQEYKDDYTARVNAYNNQVDSIKTLANLINQDRQISLNERKYQDALDSSGGLSVDDYVNLAKNGLWIDENGNIYRQPAGSNLSVSDQLNLRENELVYDDNGNLVQDTNNINGKSIGQLKDAVSSALNKYIDKKWDVDKRRRRVLEDLAAEGYTEKQMQYIEELLGEYLSYLA